MSRAIVAVKRVVDYAVKVRVKGNAVDINSVKMSMNPFCEIAVEEGVRMKERGDIEELVAVSIGPAKSADTLRQALAMGADRAIHIKTDMRTDQELQPLAVSKILQKVVEAENPTAVLMGKLAIDDDSNQCGQMLAGLLSWPQATQCSKVEMSSDKKTLKVEREVDAGIQLLEMPLPAIITSDLRLNEPRYATLPNLMKAKKKPFETIEASSYGVDLEPRLEIVEVKEPPVRQGGTVVADVDDLINKLKSEAKCL